MAPPSVPVGIPSEIVAGDTVVWDDSAFGDSRGTFAQADGYTLAYFLTSPNGTAQQVDAVTSALGWRSTLTAAMSSGLKSTGVDAPETVTWFARVSKGGESYTVAKGTLRLQPDPAKLATYTDPIDAELADIEAQIKAAKGITEYQVPGRSVTRDLSSLYKRRAALIGAKQRKANGGKFATRSVTFSPIESPTLNVPTEWIP